MKLPKAKKLPSGSWTTQVMVNGKRVSVTAPTEKECIAEAAAIKAELKEKEAPSSSITVGQAIDRYIESKDAVLSPATVHGYKAIRRTHLQGLMGVSVRTLTQEAVQRAINTMAKTASPKTVRNAHGLLSAALAVYRPDFTLRTTLPQKERHEAAIPSLDEVKTILQASRETDMEIPILLAVWLGLRASEIRGLTWDCIKDDQIHIKQAIVQGENGAVLKGTKTYSGNRWIKLPEYIQRILNDAPKSGEYIVTLSGQAIYKRFVTLCEKNGLPHYRFHDLRHTAASIAMAAGIPDKYTQQRMGHRTDNMLKTVYYHTMQSKVDEYANKIDSVYNSILQTDLRTEI